MAHYRYKHSTPLRFSFLDVTNSVLNHDLRALEKQRRVFDSEQLLNLVPTLERLCISPTTIDKYREAVDNYAGELTPFSDSVHAKTGAEVLYYLREAVNRLVAEIGNKHTEALQFFQNVFVTVNHKIKQITEHTTHQRIPLETYIITNPMLIMMKRSFQEYHTMCSEMIVSQFEPSNKLEPVRAWVGLKMLQDFATPYATNFFNGYPLFGFKCVGTMTFDIPEEDPVVFVNARPTCRFSEWLYKENTKSYDRQARRHLELETMVQDLFVDFYIGAMRMHKEKIMQYMMIENPSYWQRTRLKHVIGSMRKQGFDIIMNSVQRCFDKIVEKNKQMVKKWGCEHSPLNRMIEIIARTPINQTPTFKRLEPILGCPNINLIKKIRNTPDVLKALRCAPLSREEQAAEACRKMSNDEKHALATEMSAIEDYTYSLTMDFDEATRFENIELPPTDKDIDTFTFDIDMFN